jgi:hypothetical protein
MLLALTPGVQAADIEGQRLFVEATVTAMAAGRPRIARAGD